MEPQIHRIDRQVFNLRFSSEKSAMNARNQIRSLVDENYEKLLDEVISRFDTNGEIVYIDRIDLDLGTIKADDFSNNVKEKITRLLEEKLREKLGEKELKKAGTRVLSKEMSYLEDLVCFLESGRFSWWSSIKSLAELESFLMAENRLTSGSAPGLLRTTMKNPGARKRLALQFSPGFQLTLFKTLFPDHFPAVEIMIEQLPELLAGKISTQSERIQRELLFASWNQLFMSGKNIPLKEFPSHVLAGWYASGERDLSGRIKLSNIAEACSRINIQSEKIVDLVNPEGPAAKPSKTKQEEQISKEPAEEKDQRCTISNAGLVILSPYLETLFTTLGYIENGKFIGTALHEQALGITQYLVTGEEIMEEQELLFNKIITGWPSGMPVRNRFYFTDREKEECSQLLNAVISHWPVLKGTSVAGLRETFLARSGRLQIKESEYFLRVERSGVDVLLDQLPWSITVIRLPWMKPILFVEW